MKRFFNFLARVILFLPVKILFRTKVLGKKNRPRGVQIAIGNHLSWLDIPVTWMGVRGYRRIMAKKEIAKNPFARFWASLVGVFFIDRSKADLSVIRMTLKILKKHSVFIYPESHRNRMGNTELQEVKAGAAMFAIKASVPLVPMMIYRKPKLFRKNYVYVGQPFELSQYYGKRLDTQTLTDAAQIVSHNMRLAQEVLKDYVDNKRWKKKNRLSTDELYSNAEQVLSAVEKT